MNVAIKRKAGILIDILLFVLMITQMLYVFTGNTVHEVLGILFGLCVICHIVQKRKVLLATLRRPIIKKRPLHTLANLTNILLIACLVYMALTSMGVSRLLFPWFHAFGSAGIHRLTATAVLALSVLHGGLHVFRRRKKKAVLFITAAGIIAACVIGLWLVPYLNRHVRVVEIDYKEAVTGVRVSPAGREPLVVYFTRLGNTAFEEDVEAVSGASLLIADGEKMGSCALIADMLKDILNCDSCAIELTGELYPSSYDATIRVAQTELRGAARPAIKPVDVTAFDTVILVYPVWWGTIPMPVASFLEMNDFSGKTIELVATHGGTGFGGSVRDVRELVPEADVRQGVDIYCEDIPTAREKLLEWAGTAFGE